MSENIIHIQGDSEATSSPFWIIIDPQQNFHVNSYGISVIANMITGVFFSRESAQSHLDTRNHAFSKNAKVYCHSAHHSNEYNRAVQNGYREASHE